MWAGVAAFATEPTVYKCKITIYLRPKTLTVILYMHFNEYISTSGGLLANLLPKLTSNRPGFSGTVPVWDILSRNPELCLLDAKMSRFGFRSPGRDRMLSK